MKKSFTLIELLLSILLLSIFYSLILKLNIDYKEKKTNVIDLTKIKKKLYPNGFFLILDDGTVYFIKNQTNLFRKTKNSIEVSDKIFDNNIKNEIAFYQYTKIGWKKINNLGIYKNKKILYEFQVLNGLNKIYGILKFYNYYYVIKPFEIKKFNNLKEAKNYYLLLDYQPYKGIL